VVAGEPFVFLVSREIGVEDMDGSDDPKTAALRVVRNQALFRSVNEQIEAVNERFSVSLDGDRVAFVCECADDNCMERITMTLAQYEELRRFPTHFFVKPGHVFRQFERVVDELDGYVVVEKFGEAGKQALRLDPRRGPTQLRL
jgi:hypothetical protein